MERGISGYNYRKDTVIGRENTTQIRGQRMQGVMLELKLAPNQFFPFQVVGKNGEQSIERGSQYDLVNRADSPFSPLPPGRWPVQVSEVTPTSFTFTTAKGHFDGAGSTITFSTWTDRQGNAPGARNKRPEQNGINPITAFAAPFLAGMAWDKQASNLGSWLGQLGRR